MSGFVVEEPKSDYRDSSGLKNRLYPFTNGTLRRFQMLQLGPCAMADPGSSALAMV